MRFYKQIKKHAGTALLCTILVCTVTPLSVPAAVKDVSAESDIGGGKVCHSGHENCTYVEAVKGHPCGYIADEDEVEMVLSCKHKHDASCYRDGVATPGDAAELDCKHVHDDGCYEPETATPGDASEKVGNHVHDEDCGYVKEVEGVRCNHECEICDELYGELPKTAKYARTYADDTGDFVVNADGGIKVEFLSQQGYLQISGTGSVTVGMKDGLDSTDKVILVDASSGDITVNLDGVTIESNGSYAPIEIKGSHTVNLNLMGGSENSLSVSNKYSFLAMLKVGEDATLMIGTDSAATGSLNLTPASDSGTGIGSDNSSSTGAGDKAGTIIIKNGAISVTGGKSGIGSAGCNTVKDITITGDAVVNITSVKDVGIGAGYYGKAGNITITNGATVDITTKDATGIGSGYAGKVGNITISDGANVTVNSGRYGGIGCGYDGVAGAEAGDIYIDNATLDLTSEYGAIGNSGGSGTVGDITINNSIVTATGKEGDIFGPDQTAIGNNYKGKVGAIKLTGSVFYLNHWKLGIGTRHDAESDDNKAKEIGTGKITVEDCTINATDCGTGIRGEVSKIAGSGDIDISGYLGISETSGTGISAGGDLTLEANCGVEITAGYNPGISVGGTMNVNQKSRLDLTSKKVGIGGDGNVIFHEWSDVKIVSREEGINLTGKPSALEFKDNCKVFIQDTHEDSFDYLIRNHEGNTTISGRANVKGISVSNEGRGIEPGADGKFGGSASVLNITNEADWAGKKLEIRDKNGKSLLPNALTFQSDESYKNLMMVLPAAGDYTLYADGQRQTYLGGMWGDEELDVFTVKKGQVNNTYKFTGKGAQAKPVTGIHFDEKEITLEAGNAGSATFRIEPSDAANQNITAVSSNPDIVEIVSRADDELWMNAKKEGSVTITITTEEGGYSDTCTVNVTGKGTELTYTLFLTGADGRVTESDHEAGEIVAIHAGTKSGYKFAGWTSSIHSGVEFADRNSPDTTFVMPDHDVSVASKWEKDQSSVPDRPSGSESSGGSGDSGNAADTITRQYTGGATGTSAAWNRREDGTWTATVGGDTPKAKWVCLSNPYAGAGQPKGGWFYFDENGTMKNGWFSDVDGKRYYMEVSPNGIQGMMQVGWRWIDGKCYYFGDGYSGETLGALVTGGRTADGYEVNEAGEWIVDGVVQTR